MDFSAKCTRCNQALYGPVKYCPFCGTASPSITVTDDKQNLDTLRSEISSLLGAGTYAPDIRGAIRQKGKARGISEAAADSLLLEVLKEKGFSPVEDGTNDPLAVKWCTAERPPIEATAKQPEPPTTEETQPRSTGLRLSATRVDFDGVDVGSGLRNKTVSYEKIGTQPLTASVSTDAPSFLQVAPNSLFSDSGQIQIVLDTSNLKWGRTYSHQIIISYNGADSPVRIRVQIKVNPEKAGLGLDASAVNFVRIRAGTGIKKQSLSYHKIGDPPLVGSISTNAEFLTVTPTSLSPDSGQIQVTLDSTALERGKSYSCQLTIDYNGADSPRQLPVYISIKAKTKGLRAPLVGFVLLAVTVWFISRSTTDHGIPTQVSQVLTARDTTVNVRSSPAGSGKLRGKLKLHKGELMTVLGSQGEWYNLDVQINGERSSSWVNKSFFLQKNEVLDRANNELAANGYRNLNTEFDATGTLGVSGTVKDTSDVEKVNRILSALPGVGKIDLAKIQIEQQPPPPVPPPGGEVVLADQVKQALSNAGYRELQVVVQANHVVVEGTVESNQDFEKVAEIVLSVPGIKTVDRKLQIRTPPPPPPTGSFTKSIPPELWATGLEHLKKMISYASTDGGVNYESEIGDAKGRIERMGIKKSLPVGKRKIARAANQKGLDYQRGGRVADALQALQEAYQAGPGDVEVLNNLAYAYMLRGDLDSAQQALNSALLLAPARASAWENLGEVYAKEGNQTAAIACFANTYRFSRDRKKSYLFLKNLSETDNDSGVRDAARKSLDLSLLRGKTDSGSAPGSPTGFQEKWIPHVIKLRLKNENAEYGTRVEQTGPQEITLSGTVPSAEAKQKVEEIANGEAARRGAVVKSNLQIVQ